MSQLPVIAICRGTIGKYTLLVPLLDAHLEDDPREPVELLVRHEQRICAHPIPSPVKPLGDRQRLSPLQPHALLVRLVLLPSELENVRLNFGGDRKSVV